MYGVSKPPSGAEGNKKGPSRATVPTCGGMCKLLCIFNRRVSFNQSDKFACEFEIEKRHECEIRTSSEMSASPPSLIAAASFNPQIKSLAILKKKKMQSETRRNDGMSASPTLTCRTPNRSASSNPQKIHASEFQMKRRCTAKKDEQRNERSLRAKYSQTCYS